LAVPGFLRIQIFQAAHEEESPDYKNERYCDLERHQSLAEPKPAASNRSVTEVFHCRHQVNSGASERLRKFEMPETCDQVSPNQSS